jgi:hypothetical protein
MNMHCTALTDHSIHVDTHFHLISVYYTLYTDGEHDAQCFQTAPQRPAERQNIDTHCTTSQGNSLVRYKQCCVHAIAGALQLTADMMHCAVLPICHNTC